MGALIGSLEGYLLYSQSDRGRPVGRRLQWLSYLARAVWPLRLVPAKIREQISPVDSRSTPNY